jgi:hypothetical protein
MSDLDEALREARVGPAAGMAITGGRVVDTADGLMLFDGATATALPTLIVPVISDPATFGLCLQELCRRVGLNPADGVLWYLDVDSEDNPIWMLEGTSETRHRAGDTDNPLLSLARALAETLPD